jgi:hypothetical protein
MMRIVFVVAVLILFCAAGFVAYLSLQGDRLATANQSQETVRKTTDVTPISTHIEAVNYQAGFAIFTNGTFRIFTDPKYHHQSEDVFIQPDNVNVVHIKKTGVTWHDFFKTLPMQLTKDCLTTGTGQVFCTNNQYSLKFFINGVSTPDALDREIINGDRLLVSYGNEVQLQSQLEKVPTIQ